MQSKMAQMGSIYLCGIWLILFPLLFPYSTKVSYGGSLLSASSLFLVFATLWFFDFELPDGDVILILILGYYFFAIIGGLLGCQKQHIYDLFSTRLGI
jgi:hypothetical protein